MKTILFLIVLLFCSKSFTQNIGINTTTPTNSLSVKGSLDVSDSLAIGSSKGSAHFDLSGNANFKGVNTNTFVPNQYPNAVNFYTGRVFNTLSPGQQTGDISFQFGGNGGGLKHYLVTRHGFVQNSNSNAFDFYVNNSTTNTGSQYPGLGNVLALSVSAFGVGIGTAAPTEKLVVAGNAKINSNLIVEGNSTITGITSVANDTYVLGRLGVGVSGAPQEKLYVNGNAKIETDVSIGNRLSVYNSLAIGTANTPQQKLYVSADARVETDFTVGGNSFFNNKVNMLDKLAIGTADYPAENLYVNGTAKVENNFLVGGNVLFNKKLNILDKMAIGTAAIPTEKLYVNGNAKIETDLYVSGTSNITDLNISGKATIGQTYLFSDHPVPPSQTVGVSITCTAGTQLLTGGGGNNQILAGADDIRLSYNGPDPTNPLTVWAMYARNTGSVVRTVRIYCICARVN